jgi:hypothetical protein
MVDETLTTCPLSPAGICLYDRCPYWDQGINICNACFQDDPADVPACDNSPSIPCTIHWTEDGD